MDFVGTDPQYLARPSRSDTATCGLGPAFLSRSDVATLSGIVHASYAVTNSSATAPLIASTRRSSEPRSSTAIDS